jgi:CDP-paratose 2-epimerase
MEHIVVTGGAGFIGSHAALRFAGKGIRVTVVDNLSRSQLLGRGGEAPLRNWERLQGQPLVRCVRADIREPGLLVELAQDADAILHAAAQTAVTTSVKDPETDFLTNALGTFRVLEAARLSPRHPAVVYCSTNKVYGDRVNRVGVVEEATRYRFEEAWAAGIPEDFGVDLCEHTPYGCSKLTGDLYAQDYGHLHGLRVGIFRMSCIYGTWQFGVEDQGWVAWFVIAALTGRPITIYGNGKQVRDVLWIDDLLDAYEAFLERGRGVAVYNMGGGPGHTLSLLELLEMLEPHVGRRPEPRFAPWRPSDQRVYVSDIRKAQAELGWSPKVSPREGVSRLVAWVRENSALFS